MSESIVTEIWRGARFFAGLGPHLRRPVTVERARTIVCRRLEQRERDFLALVRLAVYGHESSPYRPLLHRAGCEYGDLERLVGQRGLEGALATLYRAGVYLTVGELKGRSPAVRGEVAVEAELERLRNPAEWVDAPAPTGVPGRRVSLYRAMFADLAVNATLALHARGGTEWAHAIWMVSQRSISGAILWLLRHRGPDYRPVRWFTRVDPRTCLNRLERSAPVVTHWISRAAGAPLPRVEFVPVVAPSPILAWMRETREKGRTPHLATPTTAAVDLCQTAERLGTDLSGVQFGVSAEPVTGARLAAIRRVGAEALPSYGAREAGLMAYGCLSPSAPDDMHFYEDVHAVIQPGDAGAEAGLPAEALLVTSLRTSSPYILLNVSLGDRAVLERRVCGCALEAVGWTTHVHTVRSFEKLRISGALLLTDDLVRLLEEVLPARFGGGPNDYQLVEDDAEVVEGKPRLRLLIHPRVGSVGPQAVADAFRAAASAAGISVGHLWGDMRWLMVERRSPYLSDHGKLQVIHRLTTANGGMRDESGGL